MTKQLNIGDEIRFFARVRGRGWSNTAAETPLGDLKGKVIAVYPHALLPAEVTEVDAMTSRGHVFRVGL